MSAKSCFGLQHGHVGVVQVQEGLQVGELVPLPQFVQACVREGDAVAFREGKDQFRLQGAFDVQVQFGYRQDPGRDSVVRTSALRFRARRATRKVIHPVRIIPEWPPPASEHGPHHETEISRFDNAAPMF